MPNEVVELNFENGVIYRDSFLGNNSFEFLNLKKEFSEINWNYSTNGKLWTYNLNYFDFLNQENISKEEGLKLIRNYVSKYSELKDGLEPYPISLRGINWIKFLSRYYIREKNINKVLYNDYLRLVDNLEYHLLANHLLENGFSLLFGAYYFQDEKVYKKAKNILREQLEEQILADGGHYELSPMYHQIILHRVLDCINLVENNSWKDKELFPLLKKKAELMLGWLDAITYKNGDIPFLNDSAKGIAPSSKELYTYANSLGLKSQNSILSDSGYRKWIKNKMEIVLDVGQIAPSYQPGHSHADSLQFVLNFKNKPVIVDTGISTYEKNDRRQLERSTSSHNTVTINESNSSNVWGGFRVAERAKVTVKQENNSCIEASHDGYSGQSIIHHRKFQIGEQFEVTDLLESRAKNYEATGHLHFHPDVKIELLDNKIIVNSELKFELTGTQDLELMDYQFAEGYNNLRLAKKVSYKISTEAKLIIKPEKIHTTNMTFSQDDTAFIN